MKDEGKLECFCDPFGFTNCRKHPKKKEGLK